MHGANPTSERYSNPVVCSPTQAGHDFIHAKCQFKTVRGALDGLHRQLLSSLENRSRSRHQSRGPSVDRVSDMRIKASIWMVTSSCWGLLGARRPDFGRHLAAVSHPFRVGQMYSLSASAPTFCHLAPSTRTSSPSSPKSQTTCAWNSSSRSSAAARSPSLRTARPRRIRQTPSTAAAAATARYSRVIV